MLAHARPMLYVGLHYVPPLISICSLMGSFFSRGLSDFVFPSDSWSSHSLFSIRFPVSTSFCPPPVFHPSYMPCSFPFHATHIFIYICKSVTLVFSLMLVCRTLSRSFKFNIFRSIARCADLIFILKVFIRAHVSHP